MAAMISWSWIGRQPKMFEMLRPILITLPRSGTHWLKSLLAHCLGIQPIERTYHSVAEVQAVLTSQPHDLVYGHFDYDVFGEFLTTSGAESYRLVLLIRHPLDALISNFHKRSADHHLPYPDRTTLDNLKAFLGGEIERRELPAATRESALLAMSYRDYLRRYAFAWAASQNVTIVRYETLVDSPAEELRRILHALGTRGDAGLIDDAVRRYSFEKLSGGRRRGDVDATSHYRRGIAGEWRSTLDSVDIRNAQDLIGDLAAVLGYEIAPATRERILE